jgi:1D-myo-inositol-triphosphate 3-kinase
LVGHPGTFKEGVHDGFVLKQRSEHEQVCCELLQVDCLGEFVPKYNGVVQDDDGKCKTTDRTNSIRLRSLLFEVFIEMEDLLSSFVEPCIMDCKMGVRTYLEEDLDRSERDPAPRTVSLVVFRVDV